MGVGSSPDKVAVIIPAHNEAPRVGAVIEPALACGIIDEVVVVDDGSGDGTHEAAEEYPVRVVRLLKNSGKGGAIKAGMAMTDASILVLVDADLVGLTCEHLEALVEPMKKDPTIDMVTSRFASGRISTNLSQRLAPALNGQRAVRRGFLESAPEFGTSRYGVETVITTHAKKSKAKVKEVVLHGVTQVMKEEKHGLTKGAKHRANMYKDIVKHSIKKPQG